MILPFKKAAEKILGQADAPLSPKEIVERAFEAGLIESAGATPDATMGAQLYVDINSNPQSLFKKVGRGKFTLRSSEASASSADVIIDSQNRLVRNALKEKLLAMEPSQFEVLVAELLEKLGYEDVMVNGRSGDKGIDVMAVLTLGGITSVKTVVQVKRYKVGNNLNGSTVTQLRGSAQVDQRGLVITTSDFTKDGVVEASAPGKIPVALVNGDKLLDLLFAHEIGVCRSEMPVYALDTEYFENESSEDEEIDAGSKRRGLWPLPGGIDAYVTTLFQLIDVVHGTAMSKRDLVRWFMSTFPQVKSEKTAGGYANVPKAIGITHILNGKIALTADGEHVRETKDTRVLYAIFAKNILGIEEIMEFLRRSPEPQTEAEVMVFLKENLGVEWTTFAQVNFRLLWLVNMGMIQRAGSAYSIIS